MGFLSRFAAGFASGLQAASYGSGQSVGDDTHWLIRMIGGGRTDAGPAVNNYTALQYPAVYACMNRIGNPLSMFPLNVMERSRQGGGVVVTEHPMSDRLSLRPNDFMSKRTLVKTGQMHALSWGNGYVEIERNGAGEAVALWPLLPWATRPDVEPQSMRRFYRTTINSREFQLDYGDVLHVMDLSQDGYCGLSPIAMARQAIGMGLAMEKFGGKFFANDAKSGGFLMHPGRLGGNAIGNINGAGREQQDNGRYRSEPLQRDLSDPGARLERQGGLDNAHRVKVLEEGMKFIQTTIPPEDAQFLGSRLFQIAEIARMYDVPLILLQSHDGNTSWGTGIEQLMIGFVRQTLAPWAHAWEQELNWKLFTTAERARGLYVRFNMNAWLRGDMAARAAFYKALFETAGITGNQICEYEDMPGFGEGGNERFVSTNVVPLSRALNPPEAPTPIAQVREPAA
jgi:phage portal protein BeeE